MSVKILSDKLGSINLYDKDGNFVTHLNGVTDVCVGHTLKVSLWNRIKWKLRLLWLRFIGKCNIYRSSAK